jgi:hypothetical protein
MRYVPLTVVLIGVGTLALDPKGPISLAERQILLNATGIKLAMGRRQNEGDAGRVW